VSRTGCSTRSTQPVKIGRPGIGTATDTNRTSAGGALAEELRPVQAIRLELGEFTPETGAALVSAGLLSVIVFPIVSLALLRKRAPATDEPAAEPRARTLMAMQAAPPPVPGEP